jgi:excisionase family DNA binding protein
MKSNKESLESNPTPSFVGAKTAAKILGLSPKTLIYWAKHKRIPHIRVGHRYRFKVEEVLAELIRVEKEIR